LCAHGCPSGDRARLKQPNAVLRLPHSTPKSSPPPPHWSILNILISIHLSPFGRAGEYLNNPLADRTRMGGFLARIILTHPPSSRRDAPLSHVSTARNE
ncbi:MAG: hypothetical protein ABW047_12435, partial [Nitrospiraceae bacterium]